MREFLSELVERFQTAWPINRLVAAATPILATVAGLFAVWLADRAPFVADILTKDQLTAVFVLVAFSAFGAAYKWLDGWQKHEAGEQALRARGLLELEEAERERDLERARKDVPKKKPKKRST